MPCRLWRKIKQRESELLDGGGFYKYVSLTICEGFEAEKLRHTYTEVGSVHHQRTTRAAHSTGNDFQPTSSPYDSVRVRDFKSSPASKAHYPAHTEALCTVFIDGTKSRFQVLVA